MSNLQGAPAAGLLSSAFNIFEGRRAQASHLNIPSFEIQADELQEYAGEFGSGEGMEIQIKVEDGKPLLILNYPVSVQVIGKDCFISPLEERHCC